MRNTRKLAIECANTISQLSGVLAKQVTHSVNAHNNQEILNKSLFDGHASLVAYFNSMAEEIMGLREEVNIIRAQYSRIIELVKENNSGEEAS